MPPVSDSIIACSNSASPYRYVHVVLLFCQLSGPIPSWHPHLPLCGSSLLRQRNGLQDEACHSCRGGPSTGTDGGGGRVSHGGVQEGTCVHRCGVCGVCGGVKWSVHHIRRYVQYCVLGCVCGHRYMCTYHMC